MKRFFLSAVFLGLIFNLSMATAGQPPPPEEIQKTLTTFFNLLKENKIDQAYEIVLVNTKIKGREDEVKALKKQTSDAIKTYGPIMGFEVIEQKRVGMSLLQVVCLSWSENVPLRWRFSYYRPGDRWKLLNILVDDRIDELFEAPAPSKPESQPSK
jgi:hypothetical protein